MWSSRWFWALLVFKFLCLKLLVHDSFGTLPTRYIHHQLFSDIESDLEVKYSFQYAEHQNSWLAESAILKCFWLKVKGFFVRKRESHSAKFKWLPSGYLYMQAICLSAVIYIRIQDPRLVNQPSAMTVLTESARSVIGQLQAITVQPDAIAVRCGLTLNAAE